MKAALLLFAIVLVSSYIQVAQAQSSCATCELVVGTIESWVENNATEAQIEQYLQTLCNNVPQFSSVCDIVVDYGLGWVISYLQSNGNPQSLCTLLTLCSSTEVKATSTECDICSQVVATVESWIASQASEQQVEALLAQVCAYVPAYTAQCQAIINAGYPTLISWIDSSANATQVCQLLGTCSASKAVQVQKPKPKVSGLECSGCQVIVNTVEGWLANNATESAIEADLMNLFCSIDGPFTATCDVIIQDGVPAFINWVQTAENGATLCGQIGICSSKKVQQPKPRLFSHVKIN